MCKSRAERRKARSPYLSSRVMEFGHLMIKTKEQQEQVGGVSFRYPHPTMGRRVPMSCFQLRPEFIVQKLGQEHLQVTSSITASHMLPRMFLLPSWL